MARIMTGRTAAFMASFGIALSGLSFSTSAAAGPTCESRMVYKCGYNYFWYYAGYASPLDCVEDQSQQNCPQPESAGYMDVLKPFTRA